MLNLFCNCGSYFISTQWLIEISSLSISFFSLFLSFFGFSHFPTCPSQTSSLSSGCVPRTAWLTGTKFNLSSAPFSLTLSLYHFALPWSHQYPKTLWPPHIFAASPLVRDHPIVLLFQPVKRPFTWFNSARNGAFLVFYPKCPIHWCFFQGTGLFACGVLPAKCFFVIRSSQISTLPPQICSGTKPGTSVTNCGAEFTAEMKCHSCGVSVTVRVCKCVRRGEVEIETGDKVPFCFCLHVT